MGQGQRGEDKQEAVLGTQELLLLLQVLDYLRKDRGRLVLQLQEVPDCLHKDKQKPVVLQLGVLGWLRKGKGQWVVVLQLQVLGWLR